MNDTEMNELRENMPPVVKEAVSRFGFHKLAARVYGVEQIDEKTAVRIIGEKLAMRRAENSMVAAGLEALKALAS